MSRTNSRGKFGLPSTNLVQTKLPGISSKPRLTFNQKPIQESTQGMQILMQDNEIKTQILLILQIMELQKGIQEDILKVC